jgi:flagellar biosynthetic protein FliR
MNYTDVSIHQFYTFLLVFARISGLVAVAPLLGNRALPRQIKVGLCLIFALGLTPLIEKQTGPLPDNLIKLAGAVITDAVFGMSLGYLARVLFASVEMAGYFMDTQMGFGFINLVNPFSEQQESLMGLFQTQLAMTLYLLANGHLVLLGAIAQSFTVVPPGAVVLHAPFMLAVIPMMKMMFVLGFRMALPAIGVLLIVDMAFGLVSRMAPQINVFIVGTPAKIIMGVITVILVLPMVAMVVGQMLSGTEVGFSALLAGAK